MKALIDYREFKRLIAATKDFASTNDAKPIHTYIKFEFHADTKEVRACAVDGYKLSIEWGYCGDIDGDFVALISPKLASKIDACEYVEVHANDQTVTLIGEHSSISYSTPDHSSFLNVDDAIPTGEPQFGIGFNPSYLQDMLKSSIAANGKVLRPLVIEVFDPMKPAVLRSQTSKRGDNVRMVLPMRYKKN